MNSILQLLEKKKSHVIMDQIAQLSFLDVSEGQVRICNLCDSLRKHILLLIRETY